MKPKLKVGDYAEVIKNDTIYNHRIGEIVRVQSIEADSIYPYCVTDSQWKMNDAELRKVNPPMTDIEQYRLSLEIMRTILVIEIAYNKKELANTINGNPSSHVDLVFFDMELNSELRLLTEILTP